MLRPIFRTAVLPAALLLLGLARIANAQAQDTYFPNDATVDYPVSSNVVVGYANYDDFYNRTNPTSPIINFVNGGSISGVDRFNSNVFIYNNSAINVSGGVIGNNLYAFDKSAVFVSGGDINLGLVAYGSSTVTVSGGSVAIGVRAEDNSTVTVSGGSIGIFLTADNSGTLNMTGTGLGATFVGMDVFLAKTNIFFSVRSAMEPASTEGSWVLKMVATQKSTSSTPSPNPAVSLCSSE